MMSTLVGKRNYNNFFRWKTLERLENGQFPIKWNFEITEEEYSTQKAQRDLRYIHHEKPWLHKISTILYKHK